MSVARNSSYSLIGQLLPLLVTVAVTPSYLRIVGAERYGILVIAWLLLGYGGLFDLGMGRVVAQHIARLMSQGISGSRRVVATSIRISFALGLFGAFVIGFIASLLLPSMIHSHALAEEARWASIWLGFCIVITTTSSPLLGAIQGQERFLQLSFFSSANTISQTIAPLISAIFFHATLPWLIASALVSRVALFVVLALTVRGGLPSNSAEDEHVPVSALELSKTGAWMTVSSIVSPLLSSLDRVLIGTISGPAAITYYSVPYNVATKFSILPASLQNAIYPRFASHDESRGRALASLAISVISLTMTPLIVIGILSSSLLIEIWLGADFSQKTFLVAPLILLGVWANSFAQIPYSWLQGRGQASSVAKLHVFELAPYLVALVGLLHWAGAKGAAIAWALRVTVDSIVLFKMSNMSEFLTTLFLPATLMLLAVLVAALVSDSFYYVPACIILVVGSFVWSARQLAVIFPDLAVRILRRGRN